MTEYTVAKWSHAVPLADGACHCGRPLKYNLSANVVGHTDPADREACPEPWPDEPNPTAYELSRRMASLFEERGAAIDRLLLQPAQPQGEQQ